MTRPTKTWRENVWPKKRTEGATTILMMVMRKIVDTSEIQTRVKGGRK
jgi:hypothetical protein